MQPKIFGLLGGTAIGDEIGRSRVRHPKVNSDTLRATCVVVEEAGEALQAALNYTRQDKKYPADLLHLIEEVEQTAAASIRLLEEHLYILLYGE